MKQPLPTLPNAARLLLHFSPHPQTETRCLPTVANRASLVEMTRIELVPANFLFGLTSRRNHSHPQNKNATPQGMALYHKPQPFLPGVPCRFLHLESGSTSLRLFIILRRYHPTIKKRLLPCQKRSHFI